jgi:hypothetical protein
MPSSSRDGGSGQAAHAREIASYNLLNFEVYVKKMHACGDEILGLEA